MACRAFGATGLLPLAPCTSAPTMTGIAPTITASGSCRAPRGALRLPPASRRRSKGLAAWGSAQPLKSALARVTERGAHLRLADRLSGGAGPKPGGDAFEAGRGEVADPLAGDDQFAASPSTWLSAVSAAGTPSRPVGVLVRCTVMRDPFAGAFLKIATMDTLINLD